MRDTAFDQEVGRNLTWLRERHHLTQAEVAVRLTHLGLPWRQETQAAVEKGKRSLSFSEALKMAKALDVSLDALLVGEGQIPSSVDDLREVLRDRPLTFPIEETFSPNELEDLAESALISATNEFRQPSNRIENAAQVVWGRSFKTEFKNRLLHRIPERGRPKTDSMTRATVIRGMYAELRPELTNYLSERPSPAQPGSMPTRPKQK